MPDSGITQEKREQIDRQIKNEEWPEVENQLAKIHPADIAGFTG